MNSPGFCSGMTSEISGMDLVGGNPDVTVKMGQPDSVQQPRPPVQARTAFAPSY
jgi:hypothetical protein